MGDNEIFDKGYFFNFFSEDRIIAICEEMEKRVEEATRARALLNVCESVIRGTRNAVQYECALEEIEKNSWQSPPELLNNILNSFERVFVDRQECANAKNIICMFSDKHSIFAAYKCVI